MKNLSLCSSCIVTDFHSHIKDSVKHPGPNNSKHSNNFVEMNTEFPTNKSVSHLI
jgi:hypothetical protein